MPKVTVPSLPLSGLFGVVKPSGPTSMSVVEKIQGLLATSRMFVTEDKLNKAKGKKQLRGKRMREMLKVGQGGTLDPLADGVLVIGVGKGTKKLNTFLDCTKEYRTTCLLGSETDSYDSQGAIVRRARWKHVTREAVEAQLPKFTGDIQQTPPIFSALKMDGMPLYDYARKGIPLPRPIEPRLVTVHELKIVEWLGQSHSFSEPDKALSKGQTDALAQALHSVDKEARLDDEIEEAAGEGERPPVFVLSMKVSGGTYVRSIVHDLAHAVGSSGHVVTLTRSRQGDYCLERTQDGDKECIPWEYLEKVAGGEVGEKGEDGWLEWERRVLDAMEVVDAPEPAERSSGR